MAYRMIDILGEEYDDVAQGKAVRRGERRKAEEEEPPCPSCGEKACEGQCALERRTHRELTQAEVAELHDYWVLKKPGPYTSDVLSGMYPDEQLEWFRKNGRR